MAETPPTPSNDEQSPNPFNNDEGLHADIEQNAPHPQPPIASEEQPTGHDTPHPSS